MKYPMIVMAVSLLSGCSAGMDTEFSCQRVDGIDGCASLTDINTLVNQGQFVTDNQGNVINRPSEATTTGTKKPVEAFSAPITAVNPPPMAGRPSRGLEDVRQITVFPYIDEQGNYHDTSVMYTVIQSTQWRMPQPH
ncbi:type IV conjugative transfer system lipoprotein TraV (plasmid) [Photobacterium damselae subsp. damselae]|uniref:type IV conjugative transfer system lipoprotein TraV n=1 Tax=Photobacterium damselae TaxID=38293 RepID=UPI00311B16B9